MTTTPPRAAKVALITGGARRVGRAVVLALAETGYDIAFTYHHSADDAAALVAQLREAGRIAHALPIDLAEPDAADALHDAFVRHFDRLDALVNNAAIFAPTRWGQVTDKDYARYQQVNALTPLLLTQRFAPMLAAHHAEHAPASTGRVVNFVDVHVTGEPMPGYAAYNASKAALLEITRTCAVELAPHVTVNAVAPGVVAWAEDFSAEHRQHYLQRVPLGRAGTPEDAAAAVRYLVCDAHYCTGEVIRVDGGRKLR